MAKQILIQFVVIIVLVFTRSLNICFRVYWKLPARGPPKSSIPIRDTWPDLPSNIDTAFQDPKSKKIFFFSGERLTDHQTVYFEGLCMYI